MWHLTLFIIVTVMSGVFIFNSQHVLGSLVVLEFLVLTIYVVLTHQIFSVNNTAYVLIVLFVVSVSAAGVGLSLLIPLARSHGKDYFSSFKLLW